IFDGMVCRTRWLSFSSLHKIKRVLCPEKLDHLKMLFQKLDENLRNAFCHYKSETNSTPPAQNDFPPFTPPPFGCIETIPPTGLCQWRILEVCTDSDTQTTWFGSTDGPLPSEIAGWLDGDHDDDGVPDQDDEDYSDWYDEFTQWWGAHYDTDLEDVFDGDHDNDGIIDAYDPDWDIFFGGLEGQLEDIGDWFDDVWDDITDWWDDLWTPEIECPWPPLNGSVEDRTITCEWFYVLDCGSGAPGANWYDTFVDVVPCPECPGYWEYHDMLRDRLYAHWNAEYTSAIGFWDLYDSYDILDWECNAYSPCFESCVNEHFAQTPIILAPPEDELPITDLSAALQACFGQSCSQCTYSVILYIEQPVPGSREAYDLITGGGSAGSGSGYNAGHTFLSLVQTKPDGSVKRKTIGYYPSSYPNGQEEISGFWYNEDDASRYNIRVQYNVTSSQFEAIKTNLAQTYWMFQIQYNNCTIAATSPLIAAGIPIPHTSCYVPLLGTIQATPSNLGEDLRSNSQGGNFFSSPNHLPLTVTELSNCP
ncbi:MAG: hypothetical protein SFV22_06860, partial [Saprospiraceae bacterium]|nr:hypothetical protein [Saprospiraceae bacterium]